MHTVQSRTQPTRVGLLLSAMLVAFTPSIVSGNGAGQDQAEPSETISIDTGRSQHITAAWPVKGVSLTNPEIADVQVLTPKLLLVSGKSSGLTDLILWNDKGETQSFRLEVSGNMSHLEQELAGIFPSASLRVVESENVLVVTGMLERAEHAEQLHAYLDALQVDYVDATALPGLQQVQVKVRIAEVSRQSLRSLGVNALLNGSDGFLGSTVGSSTGGAINPINIGAPGGATLDEDGYPFAFNSPTNVSPAVTLFGGLFSTQLQVFLEALSENQYLRVLAEPNLVALSGQEASFLAGGEFPIPVVQGGTGGGGGTSITIEYKEFGVALKFRPVVLGDNSIRLRIASEVSDLSDLGAVEIQGFQVPSVITRRAETTLEMFSGQTFAMAGLIQEATNARASRVPGLGSLPILGQLFRSVRYKTGETELLVLVTVSLVEPLSKITMPPLPGMEHVRPDDWELYALGQIEGNVPSRLNPDDAAWLQSLGLHNLEGPGAWAVHEDEMRIGRPDTNRGELQGSRE